MLLLGPGCADPAVALQRLAESSSLEALVVLAPRVELERMRTAAMLAPHAPPRTIVVPIDDDEDLEDQLEAIFQQIIRGVEHRRLLEDVNRAVRGRREEEPRAAKYLDALMQQAPIGVLLIDADGHVLEANPASERLLADDLGSPRGRHVGDLLETPPPAAWSEAEQRTVLSRTGQDGTEQVLEVIRTPVDAEPVAGLVLVHDVTVETLADRQRRRAEQDLLFQKSLLEAQSEAAVEGILVVDREGKILSHNRRFVEMWNIPEAVVESRSDDAALQAVLDLVHEPDAFLARVRYLYGHPRETSRDEIHLRDGRVFDRYSAPVIRADGIVQGRVWFFHDVTEQRRNETALRFAAESADILADTLDARMTLARIARLAVPRLGDWCVVYRKHQQDGTIERVAMEFSDPRDIFYARQLERYTIDPDATEGVSAVIRSGRSILVSDVTPEHLSVDVLEREEFVSIVRDIGVSSWMCVPLEARGRVVGAMSFITSHSGRRYDRHHLALAEDLGHRAGLAMDNALLFEHQRRIARTLQQSLLPRRMPDVEGLDIGVRYIAGGEGYDVGGDFYDLFPTAEDSWGLVIGDVVGKGPDAAALTALARYTVRTAAMQDPAPASVLGVLNDAIERQHEGSRFCTAVYARFRRVDDEFVFSIARAGHPPPLLLRADGTIDEIAPPGLLLGVFDDPRLVEAEIRLGPGDTLVLYTDGVVEARTGPTTLGEQGLVELLEHCHGLDADRCADEIERSVLDLETGFADDDVALVVLRVEATKEHAGWPEKPTESAWFTPRPESLREVRAFVRAATAGTVPPAEAETAVLLADELATNAIRHARTDFRVAVGRAGSTLRVDVRDESPLPPHVLPVDPNGIGGRGLQIIASEASRWGVSHRVDGKSVWFELDLQDLTSTER